MSIPINKEELLTSINITYKKLRKELLSIPIELTSEVKLTGHRKETLMSVNNLVAYLIGWGELVLKWNEKKDNNEQVDFPETGYKWNELGALAQKFYTDYGNDDFYELLAKLEAVHIRILSVIESKSNEELYQSTWYEKYTLGRMIQFNTSSPYANATGRIRKFLSNPNTIL